MLGTLGMNRPADEVQRLLSDDIWMVSDEAAGMGAVS
jgi:malonyl-CoA decarboxylase